MPREARRDSVEEESSGESSTTRVLMMLAVLVSLVAVLGMVQVREKQRQPVPWPTAPFEVGVPVRSVVFSPADGVATITVDEAGWLALTPDDRKVIGQRFAQLSQPFGATTIQIAGSAGTPLTMATGNTVRTLPAPPVP